MCFFQNTSHLIQLSFDFLLVIFSVIVIILFGKIVCLWGDNRGLSLIIGIWLSHVALGVYPQHPKTTDDGRTDYRASTVHC